MSTVQLADGDEIQGSHQQTYPSRQGARMVVEHHTGIQWAVQKIDQEPGDQALAGNQEPESPQRLVQHHDSYHRRVRETVDEKG